MLPSLWPVPCHTLQHQDYSFPCITTPGAHLDDWDKLAGCLGRDVDSPQDWHWTLSTAWLAGSFDELITYIPTGTTLWRGPFSFLRGMGKIIGAITDRSLRWLLLWEGRPLGPKWRRHCVRFWNERIPGKLKKESRHLQFSNSWEEMLFKVYFLLLCNNLINM